MWQPITARCPCRWSSLASELVTQSKDSKKCFMCFRSFERFKIVFRRSPTSWQLRSELQEAACWHHAGSHGVKNTDQRVADAKIRQVPCITCSLLTFNLLWKVNLRLLMWKSADRWSSVRLLIKTTAVYYQWLIRNRKWLSETHRSISLTSGMNKQPELKFGFINNNQKMINTNLF